jgi:hypothetical protein
MTIPQRIPDLADGAANKEVARRLMEEVWGERRLDLLAELVAGEYVEHAQIGDYYGPAGARIGVGDYHLAFPDLTVQVDELLTEGDKVVRRFTLCGTHTGSLPGWVPSGLRVELHGIAIDRIADGKLAESWILIEPLPSNPGPAAG